MSVGVHVHGEILITQQLACGRVRHSRIARRSGEDSPVDWYRTQAHLDGAGARGLIRVTANDRHQALTSPRARGHTAKWNAAKPKRSEERRVGKECREQCCRKRSKKKQG